PVEDVLAHPALHEADHLLRRRWPLPLRREGDLELAEVVERELDLVRDWRRLAMPGGVSGEEQQPHHEEVDKWLAQETPHSEPGGTGRAIHWVRDPAGRARPPRGGCQRRVRLAHPHIGPCSASGGTFTSFPRSSRFSGGFSRIS